jgi:hypothetical protein
MTTTDTILTLVTMVSIAIIVQSASMFVAINTASSEIILTARIPIKFVMMT